MVIQNSLTAPTAGVVIRSEVPSGSQTMTSNRAETAGLLFGMQFLSTFASWAGVVGSITIACDNMQAVRASESHSLISADDADFDLRQEIQRQLRTSPVQFKVQHVKGHANAKSNPQMSDWEVLNVVADHEAGEHWRTINHAQSWGEVSGNPQSSGWAVASSNGFLSEASYEAVAQEATTASIQNKWRQRWGSVARYTVDWRPMMRAIGRWAGGQQRAILKLASGNAASGRNMCRQGQSDSGTCPRCGQAEDNHHVVRCTSEASTEIWAACIQRIRAIIQPPRVRREAAQLLVKALRVLQRGGNPPQGIRRTATQDVEMAQHGVGWDALIWGGWSTEWEKFSPNPPPSSRRRRPVFWQADVTHELWLMVLQQWTSRNQQLHEVAERDSMTQRMLFYCQALRELPEQFMPIHLRQLARQAPTTTPRQAKWLLTLLHAMPHIAATVPAAQIAWMKRKVSEPPDRERPQ